MGAMRDAVAGAVGYELAGEHAACVEALVTCMRELSDPPWRAWARAR
jgi:hypothetical protein